MEIEVVKTSGDVQIPLSLPRWKGLSLPGPRRMTVQVRGGDVDVQVDIAFVKGEGRYVVQAVRGANLSSEVLHALRPPEIVREAVMGTIFVLKSGSDSTSTLVRQAAATWAGRFLRARLRGLPRSLDEFPPDDAVSWVAALYQLAYLVGQRPTATVIKGFDLPRSTAGRLIRQARDQGLLGPTTERKAGV